MVFIQKSFRGNGFGRDVLEKVNSFLDLKNKPGILSNAIRRSSPARSMYENHGWRIIEGHEDYYGYKIPNLRPGQLEKAIHTINRRY